MDIRIITTKDKEYQESLNLRDDVLRQPLGMSIADDDLSKEVHATHFLAYENETCLGTLYLLPFEEKSVQMKQVAVHPDYRRQGIGRQLIAHAEKWAIQQGINRILLHARVNAWAFYESLSYAFISEEYEEVGILHKTMEKRLTVN